MIHQLKCATDSFQAIIEGRKLYTIRTNDRNFQTLDLVVLHEIESTEPLQYTGRSYATRITHITHDHTDTASHLLRVGACVLGLSCIGPVKPEPKLTLQEFNAEHPEIPHALSPTPSLVTDNANVSRYRVATTKKRRGEGIPKEPLRALQTIIEIISRADEARYASRWRLFVERQIADASRILYEIRCDRLLEEKTKKDEGHPSRQ